MIKLFLLLIALPSFISAMSIEINGTTAFIYSKILRDRIKDQTAFKDQIKLAVQEGKIQSTNEPDIYLCSINENNQVVIAQNFDKNEISIVDVFSSKKLPKSITTNHLGKKEKIGIQLKKNNKNATNRNTITKKQFENL